MSKTLGNYLGYLGLRWIGGKIDPGLYEGYYLPWFQDGGEGFSPGPLWSEVDSVSVQGGGNGLASYAWYHRRAFQLGDVVFFHDQVAVEPVTAPGGAGSCRAVYWRAPIQPKSWVLPIATSDVFPCVIIDPGTALPYPGSAYLTIIAGVAYIFVRYYDSREFPKNVAPVEDEYITVNGFYRLGQIG